MAEGYQGYDDVARNYHWATGDADHPAGIGSLFKIAEGYGFRGGPPRVRLLDLAQSSEQVDGVATTQVSRWAKLTRRGAQLMQTPPAGMVIPGWLRDKGFTIVLAQRGTGKTLVAVDMSLCIATNQKWMGEPISSGFHVVYLCGEDQENTAAHIAAWCARHNSSEVPDRFTFIEDVPDLTSSDDCAALAEHIRTLVPQNSRVVIVADTWQRATSKARDGQNSDHDMAAAVENLEDLAKTFRGPAIGCFHPPKHKDDTVLGSSVTENTSTGIWLLSKTDNGLKLEVTRLKGRGLGNYKYLRLEEVKLGRRDDFGFEITGGLVVHIGGTLPNAMEQADWDQLEREAVRAAAFTLIDKGIQLVRSNGTGQKPQDVAKMVLEKTGLLIDKRKVLAHLNALERDGVLTYVEANKNSRIKAGFRPASDVVAESFAEGVPKSIPKARASI